MLPLLDLVCILSKFYFHTYDLSIWALESWGALSSLQIWPRYCQVSFELHYRADRPVPRCGPAAIIGPSGYKVIPSLEPLILSRNSSLSRNSHRLIHSGGDNRGVCVARVNHDSKILATGAREPTHPTLILLAKAIFNAVWISWAYS